MYQKLFPQSDINYHFYLNYFNENFSLRFGRPQVDTCITCEQLSLKIKIPFLKNDNKTSIIEELSVHKIGAKEFYKKIAFIQNLCKEREDIAAITFDYMQNLPLPNIPVQDIFYLRQLWVNCFGIKDLRTGKSTFYMYHEGIARKVANDVCSMLLLYMNENFGSEVKQVYLFSDGCPGQNKNKQ